MKIRTEKVIDIHDWDECVKQTYGRPYSFQQQDGCRGRGAFGISVPDIEWNDYKATSIPEIVNSLYMGVSFEAWLARDPKTLLSEDKNGTDHCGLILWWKRNFYPDISMICNDLHKRGLLEAGGYIIDIDW